LPERKSWRSVEGHIQKRLIKPQTAQSTKMISFDSIEKGVSITENIQQLSQIKLNQSPENWSLDIDPADYIDRDSGKELCMAH
jgi:hypothetical protein